MEQNYNEQEIAEHYIGIIKSKREQGFTDEQIAKDIGFPLETVQRVNTNDTLPDNPNEDDNEDLPIQNDDRTSDRDDSSEKELDNNQNEKLDVKEEYTLEQSAEDMFSDDFRDRLKAEYAQTKIRYSRLASYIAEVKAKIAAGIEVDMYESLDLLEIQLTAMGTYITVLSKRLKIINIIETKEEQNNE